MNMLLMSLGKCVSSWLSNGQKNESIVELKASGGKNSQNPETVSLSAWVKRFCCWRICSSCCSKWVVMKPSDDGKLTDKSNHDEDRLFAGQQYETMLSRPEDVYYRVKPDTSKLEEGGRI